MAFKQGRGVLSLTASRMYIRLAWRNIWRNTRRTTVILTAVVIGIWSMLFLGALMRGIAVGMIKNGISTLTGHIQIHHKGYRNDPSVENSMAGPERVQSVVKEVLPAGARRTARVRVEAVATNARHSIGVTLVGIDPGPEAEISFIGGGLSRGRYLRPDDPHGILVGEALLEKFETRLGRRLVLMSQDTRGEIASRAFRIVGTFKAEMKSTERRFVFVTRKTAQEMLNLGGSISEISILLPSQKEIPGVAAALRARLGGDQYEVHTWRDLLPMLDAYLELYDGFIYIWYLVVFVAMAFGVVNTSLMAVFERIREFGLLKALGMKPWWILKEVLTEAFFLLLLGLSIGNLLAFLSVRALSTTGIDLSAFAAGAEFAGMSRIIYPALIFRDWAMANLVVMILGLLVSAYPAAKAARFIPVKALAHT